MTTPIRFDDGAGYERFMGAWSQQVGSVFLDWLAPAPGLRWLDVGCGNGAFTELLAGRCAPAALDGIDPSAEQLAFARTRSPLQSATFQQADAMALPFADGTFDAAVMPLVIFFVPDPAAGVAEMVRVVEPGGVVAAYAWDMDGGGFPYAVLHDEMRALDIPVPLPPSPEASQLDVLSSLWAGGGVSEVETRTITVERTFTDFDDFWATIQLGPSVSRSLPAAGSDVNAALQARMRQRLSAAADGTITYAAVANAVRGRVPV
jgi:SAM-dependent methyltransferase